MTQNKPITLILDVDKVNQILAALDAKPHIEVRGLVDMILDQANQQVLPKQTATAPLDEEVE